MSFSSLVVDTSFCISNPRLVGEPEKVTDLGSKYITASLSAVPFHGPASILLWTVRIDHYGHGQFGDEHNIWRYVYPSRHQFSYISTLISGFFLKKTLMFMSYNYSVDISETSFTFLIFFNFYHFEKNIYFNLSPLTFDIQATMYKVFGRRRADLSFLKNS